MGWFQKLPISDRVFLPLNLAGMVVGVALMIISGPTAPLVLLTVGATGLALKKLPIGEDQPPA